MSSFELADRSAIAGRLALILIDNVVELLMYRRCEDIFQREAGFDPDPAKPGRCSRAARVESERWRREYNEERPKKALGGLTPALYAKQLAGKALTMMAVL